MNCILIVITGFSIFYLNFPGQGFGGSEANPGKTECKEGVHSEWDAHIHSHISSQ